MVTWACFSHAGDCSGSVAEIIPTHPMPGLLLYGLLYCGLLQDGVQGLLEALLHTSTS